LLSDINGYVDTIAGSHEGYEDGKGTTAEYYEPWGIAVDTSGIHSLKSCTI
jgi:hypothetical protein